MTAIWIILAVAAVLTVLFFLTVYICFYITFYVKRKPLSDEFTLPPGKAYLPFKDMMFAWMKETREMRFEEMCITSFDGLKLYGKYYEYEKGAPLEIMFPGYRGLAERDLCGAVQRSFILKRNALVVDQRTCGKSEGNVITFGIKEHKDCIDWVNFALQKFGNDTKIIITGISMGAATVIMAAAEPLPKNVIGVLADCGYSSAKDIIKEVIKQIGLSPKIMYPFVKLAARIFGGFDLEEYSPMDAVKKCNLPIIFVHGENDNFVPCEMSRQLYDACVSKKVIFTVPGADHGLSYVIDTEGYFKVLNEFKYE